MALPAFLERFRQAGTPGSVSGSFNFAGNPDAQRAYLQAIGHSDADVNRHLANNPEAVAAGVVAIPQDTRPTSTGTPTASPTGQPAGGAEAPALVPWDGSIVTNTARAANATVGSIAAVLESAGPVVLLAGGGIALTVWLQQRKK